MPLEIPLPSASIFADVDQYIPLLVTSVDIGINTPKVWAASDWPNAAEYMQDVIQWLIEVLPTMTVFPVGMITSFGGSAAPSGWLLCEGQLVSRTTYSALFAAIGTSFGIGDGSTTFALPDLQGRAPIGVGFGAGLTRRLLGQAVGEESHALSIAELAAHDHGRNPTSATEWVLKTSAGASGWGAGSASASNTISKTSSTGSGTAHNNMQPSLAVNFMIYAGV